ncbi:MAG: hypothetical protein NTZ26_15680 [Candidatus Aminicenantes bacterium]|nr:hypothetical protein [Candidatus Aminicenantes bacterium]
MTPPNPSDRLKTSLSVLIALAATTAALVSWQASRVGIQAAAADSAALAAGLDEASTEFWISADIFSNLTDAREFLVHRENAKAINEEYLHNPNVPAHWQYEWQSEMIRARARRAQLFTDFLKTDGDHPVFEDRRYRETTRAQAATEKAVDPTPFLARATERRQEARRLVELNALFTLAIFVFTIVLKTDIRRKTLWTAAGAALYLIGAGIAVVRILF